MTEYKFSYWEKDTFLKNIDVAIIGSGIVGLTTAIYLKRRNEHLNVIILERGALPIGASTRNAGFACIGSMTEILDDLNGLSLQQVQKIIQKRYSGLQLLRKLVGEEKLEYDHCGGFEIFTKDQNEAFDECQKNMSEWNKWMNKITGLDDTFEIVTQPEQSFGFKGIKHIIKNNAEGAIHTGSMMSSLINIARKEGIVIMNGIEVEKITSDGSGHYIHSITHDKITSAKVVITVNGFASRFLPEEDILPARNQVLVTNEIAGLNVKGTFHYNKGYVYARNVGNRILIGGFRNLDKHRETTEKFGTTSIIKNSLINFLKEYILPNKDFNIEYEWSGIMGIGCNKEPIIKRISNNLYAGVRLGGMGVAIGTLVGQELAELVLE